MKQYNHWGVSKLSNWRTPRNVWNDPSNGITQLNTTQLTSPTPPTSNNPQKEKKKDTTPEESLTLDTKTIITHMLCTQLHHKQMRTAKKDATDASPCLRGTRYACVRVEIANLFPHSTVLDPKGFRRKIGHSHSVCLSGFSYDTWYIHSINQCINDTSINVYTIHIPSINVYTIHIPPYPFIFLQLFGFL